MACTHPYWSALQVGSQHLARQFAGHGWEVHYFSAPVSWLHLPMVFQPEVAARFKASLGPPARHFGGRIRSHIPLSFMAPAGMRLLRSRAVTHNWFRTMVPSLGRMRRKWGTRRVDLLYIDNLSYHFLLDHVSYDRCVFRVMDMHERFPGWNGEARRLAERIARRADVTVYSAKNLQGYVDTLGGRRFAFVPNGVDFSRFSAKSSARGRHPLLRNIPDPVVLYSGMIDSRLDFGLLRRAARTLPHVSFVLAGPVSCAASCLTALPENVHLTGSVPHDELPLLMGGARAGLIPFDVDRRMDAIQGIRPLKLLEYLAAGIPAISAGWPELVNMNSPAWVYESGTDFAALVKRAVENDYDPKEGLDFARDHDWKRSFDVMMKMAAFP